jgi:lycopene cyclase domain-containing protein
MESNFLYLKILFWSFIFPFIFSFFPQFPFYKEFRYFWKSCGIVALFEIAWDVLYNYLGVWGFSDRYTLGFRVFGLPFEELLFFIVIPFCCTFLFFCAMRYKIFESWIPIDAFIQKYLCLLCIFMTDYILRLRLLVCQ